MERDLEPNSGELYFKRFVWVLVVMLVAALVSGFGAWYGALLEIRT